MADENFYRRRSKLASKKIRKLKARNEYFKKQIDKAIELIDFQIRQLIK